MKTLSPDELEALRDEMYFRTSAKQVHTLGEAARFVDENGLAFAFSAKKSELPCLWHAACGRRDPEMPLHTHHDPHLGLVWNAKDVLPMEKRIYYGKALRRRPTMISLELFPSFYAMKGSGRDPFRPLPRGRLSPTAYRIAKALENSPPQPTKDLRLAVGCSSPSKRYAFDRALAELQERLLIVKIAEEYEPFSFIWGRLDRWLGAQVEAARSLSAEEGRSAVLAKYFSRVIAAQPGQVARLFGWDAAAAEKALEFLAETGVITDRVVISDGVAISPGKWYIHTDYC
jgi:hypothetical protein